MSKRVRLTKRQAAEDETPYSGEVGNADRTDPKPDAYSIDDYEVPGWELQEDGDPSENDKRLENNVPAMAPKDERTGRKPVASETVTRVRQAAAKAVKLAVLFLGDRVPQSVVEAQAKDFMRLGSTALNNALKRYTATEALYAEEEMEEVVEEEVVEPADETPSEEACENVEAEDETPSEEACVKSKEDEEMEEEEVEEVEEVEEAPAETSEEETEEEMEEEVEVPLAKKATKKPSKKQAEVAEMDIELSAPEGEIELSEDEEAELASLYAEDDDEEMEVEVEEETPTAKKAGVKKLGGQPKVASKGNNEVDLTSLWATEPDVSDVFK